MNDPQILDEEPILRLHAVLPMQQSQDCLLFLVQVIDDGLGVVKGASRENIHVVVLAHVGQKLIAIGPHVELELISLVRELHIGLLVGEHRMDESLVEVQNEKFLLGI